MRVGGGFEEALSEDAVEGVTPSGFAAVVGAIGAFLWMGMGGILGYYERRIPGVFESWVASD